MSNTYKTRGQNKIQYWFHEESALGETWAADNTEVRRALRTRFKTRSQFISDMVGFAHWDQTSPTFQRGLPEPDTEFSWLRCVECRLREPVLGCMTENADQPVWVEPDSSGNLDLAKDGYVLYDCVFRPLKYELVTSPVVSELQRYVERDEKNGIDSLRVPGQTFEWAATGDVGSPDLGYGVPPQLGTLPIPEPMNVLQGVSQIQYIWHQVPGRKIGNIAILPRLNITACQGKVNSTSFDPGYGPTFVGGQWVYPPETLLFDTMEARRVWNASGEPYFTVIFNLLYKPTGWNKLLRYVPAGGGNPAVIGYFKVIAATGTRGPYETADLNSLFRFN